MRTRARELEREGTRAGVRRAGALVLCALTGACGTPGTERATEAAPLHGSLSTRYVGRATADDQDHDLRAWLVLDLADARRSPVSGHLAARADLDLDGLDEGPAFDGLDESYDRALVAHLHEAYADLALGSSPETASGTLRIGRHSDPELPEFLRLDGAAYRSRPRGPHAVAGGLYGGLPARFYDEHEPGEAAYGTFLEAEPWRGARGRLDWLHLEDEVLLGPHEDDLVGLSLWQVLRGRGWLEGRVTSLEGDGRDLDLRLQLAPPQEPTQLRLRYHELLTTQTVQALEFDPFSQELVEFAPYRELGLDLAHELGAHVALELGLAARKLRDASDEGDFNRDWERGSLSATLRASRDAPLALTLGAERWHADGQDSDALEAGLAYDDGGPWCFALGSAYALYDYRWLELEEREDVRSLYLDLARELGRHCRLELGYELADDDLATWHELTGGLRWRF